jgi:hypothetical protein
LVLASELEEITGKVFTGGSRSLTFIIQDDIYAIPTSTKPKACATRHTGERAGFPSSLPKHLERPHIQVCITEIIEDIVGRFRCCYVFDAYFTIQTRSTCTTWPTLS